MKYHLAKLLVKKGLKLFLGDSPTITYQYMDIFSNQTFLCSLYEITKIIFHVLIIYSSIRNLRLYRNVVLITLVSLKNTPE